MKRIILFTIAASSMVINFSNAQNVGIDLSNPLKKLSIKGSLLIDQENENLGTLDSAALLFGTTTKVGISSNRSGVGNNINGLDFWTNGFNRLSLLSNGRIGVNTVNPQQTFDVNGSGKFSYLYTGGLNSTGSIFSENNINAAFDVNADDDIYAGGDGSVMGRLGVGGAFNSSYTLRVVGNGLFTTNVGIDGTLRVDGKITNDGKAIMKSNSGTTLRSGFTKGVFGIILLAGQQADIKFCIPTFEGDNDNVRVMPCQLIAGSGASSTYGQVNINVVGTLVSDAICNGGSAAVVRISNPTSSTINVGTGATLYLYTVVTD